jgi:hypothetical protein
MKMALDIFPRYFHGTFNDPTDFFFEKTAAHASPPQASV